MNLPRLRRSIKTHEGKRLHPYLCPAGALTIGYGHNLDAHGISDAVAERLLDEDIVRAIDGASSACRAWGNLDGVRQEVLVEMVFQMGSRAVAKFARMNAALERGDYEAAADHALDSQWAYQTPRRAQVLARRLRTGEYEDD